jgi:2',3'-cyclic-nucleotide 2'-phosphodiesterase (5'-nucleotidase family)
MRRSFSHSLLITCFFLVAACKSQYVHTSSETRNLIVSDSAMPVDSQLVYLYLPYKQELEKNITRIISVTREEMVKGKPESNLTNFLADLLLEEGSRSTGISGQTIEPDISYFNYGGIRTFLPKGEITVGKIFELMPFENELVFLKLSGKQVQEFLNHIAAKGGDSLGGVRFTISDNTATEIEIDNTLLKPEDEYWLVTNDYIASGGDGLELLTKPMELVSTNRKIRDAIISFMERKQLKNEEIFVRPDGRIRIDKSQQNN